MLVVFSYRNSFMIEQLNNHRRLLICIFLAVVTFAVYFPVRNYDLVHLDDDVYVKDNAEIKSGLNIESIKWAFTTGQASNWHPLTWLSLMLDCEFFGVKPGPMHIVNVLFHVANTILLFVVLARMTKGVWQSAFVAGLVRIASAARRICRVGGRTKRCSKHVVLAFDDAGLRAICRASVGAAIHRCAGFVRYGAFGQADAGYAAFYFATARLLAA